MSQRYIAIPRSPREKQFGERLACIAHDVHSACVCYPTDNGTIMTATIARDRVSVLPELPLLDTAFPLI